MMVPSPHVELLPAEYNELINCSSPQAKNFEGFACWKLPRIDLLIELSFRAFQKHFDYNDAAPNVELLSAKFDKLIIFGSPQAKIVEGFAQRE